MYIGPDGGAGSVSVVEGVAEGEVGATGDSEHAAVNSASEAPINRLRFLIILVSCEVVWRIVRDNLT